MTKDMAEAIILNQSKERGFKLTPEELSRDAERFASEYNRLMGIRDVDGGKLSPLDLKIFRLEIRLKTLTNTRGLFLMGRRFVSYLISWESLMCTRRFALTSTERKSANYSPQLHHFGD